MRRLGAVDDAHPRGALRARRRLRRAVDLRGLRPARPEAMARRARWSCPTPRASPRWSRHPRSGPARRRRRRGEHLGSILDDPVSAGERTARARDARRRGSVGALRRAPPPGLRPGDAGPRRRPPLAWPDARPLESRVPERPVGAGATTINLAASWPRSGQVDCTSPPGAATRRGERALPVGHLPPRGPAPRPARLAWSRPEPGPRPPDRARRGGTAPITRCPWRAVPTVVTVHD